MPASFLRSDGGVGMTRPSGGRLAATTALVTGASQGLGRAIALAYAREGADLVLVARRPEPLERVRGEVEALGARAVVVAADVGDPDDVERVAAAALTAFDRVDVLVNNASELGPTPMPYLLDTDPDALRRVLDVNLLGPFLLTRALLGPMLAAGRGSVINVSSDAGVVGYPGWGAYGVSKAALDQMTQDLGQRARRQRGPGQRRRPGRHGHRHARGRPARRRPGHPGPARGPHRGVRPPGPVRTAGDPGSGQRLEAADFAAATA